MRILQIPNYQYPNIGGIEQTSRDISNILSTIPNVEHKTICFNEDACDGEYVCRRKETIVDIVDDYEVTRCGCIAKVASQSISLTYPKELFRLIKNFKPDIVIFHYPNPFVASFLLPMLPKFCKFIVYWHLDIVKQKLLGKLFKIQNERICKRADNIISTSPNYVEGSMFLSKYKEKVTVIPSCIRPEKMPITDVTRKKYAQIIKENNGKTICFAIGRHVPYKGMEYLVKASKLLDDSYSILIGGKGELTKELKELAKDDKKVTFLGRVPDDEMVAYYKACDIFCFPSITKNEAFGLSLAEAMYFGKPAITFNIPGSGVNYVSIDKETGVECPNGDYSAFANAIKELAGNDDLRNKYGRNAELRSKSKFLFDEFKENITDFLNKNYIEENL